MQKDKLINVALFLLSFAFIYMIAYPMYAGSGYNVLGKSNIMFEYAKNRELKNLQAVAIDLKDNGVNQSTAYANVDKYKKSRIEIALPSKIDIARVINDIDKMAEKSNVKLSDIKFTKIANNKKFSELNIYNIGFTMTGVAELRHPVPPRLQGRRHAAAEVGPRAQRHVRQLCGQRNPGRVERAGLLVPGQPADGRHAREAERAGHALLPAMEPARPRDQAQLPLRRLSAHGAGGCLQRAQRLERDR